MSRYGNSDYGNEDILGRLECFRRDSITLNQAWQSEANIDMRVESGDPYVFSTIPGYNAEANRNVISLNRVRPLTNMVSGYQRQNRNSTTIIPIEHGDQQTADQFTKIFSWAHRSEGILETLSDAFQGALISGMNLVQVYVDYRDDPISGNIKVDRCAYNSFIIDPYFRKADLSDCNGILKRSYLTREDVASLLPAYEEEIYNISDKKSGDGKFTYMPENLTLANNNLLTYDEFYYRDFRTRRMLADKEGLTKEWTGSDEDLEEYLSFFPEIAVIDQTSPTVSLAIVVQGNVFYNGRNPLGTDKYPFVPVFAYYRPESDDLCTRIQGIVRGLRDAQYIYNRVKSNENDILESQVNTGIIVKENAMVNFDDVFKKGTGQILILKDTAQMTDIEFKSPPAIPPSTFQLSESYQAEFTKVSGINEELLGSATDDKSGILSQLRQGSSLTTLRPLFDQLDRSQKLMGSIMLEVIQNNFTPGKVKRIIEEEPTQEFYHKAFGKYDCAVEEGINTTTQRQYQFAQLIHLRGEVGIPIPDEVLLEATTIQDKKKLIEAMKQEKEQTNQMQQMQIQAQLDLNSAQIEAMQAKAKADLGWAFERTSRVPENRAFAIERLAEAEKDRQQAVLNMAKTLTELDESKLNQLGKVLELTNLLSQQSVPEKVNVATPSFLEKAMFKQVSRDNQDQTKNEQSAGQPAAAGV